MEEVDEYGHVVEEGQSSLDTFQEDEDEDEDFEE